MRQWRKLNPDAERKHSIRYRETHKVQLQKYRHRYYECNKEKINARNLQRAEYFRGYYKRRAEHFKEQYKKRYEEKARRRRAERIANLLKMWLSVVE